MQDKVVSKSGIAAELRCSPSSISSLVAHGLPVRSDGKLNRHQVLSWIVQTCSGVGGGWEGGIRGKASIRERAVHLLGDARPNARKADKPHGSRPREESTARTLSNAELREIVIGAARAGAEDARRDGSDFKGGLAWACLHLCKAVRKEFPTLLAGMDLPTDGMSAGEASVLTRIAVFAWFDYLLQAWSVECFACGRELGLDVELPPIPWEGAFGKKYAADMRRLYEIEIAVLKGEEITDQEEVINIPDSLNVATGGEVSPQ